MMTFLAAIGLFGLALICIGLVVIVLDSMLYCIPNDRPCKMCGFPTGNSGNEDGICDTCVYVYDLGCGVNKENRKD